MKVYERPDRDKCGAPTASGSPCQHPAPPMGSTCASNHEEPVNRKRTMVTQSTVKKRGWTMAMIRDLLGEPDRETANPWYSQVGAPMKLFFLERVIAAESTEEFRLALEKADNRRESSKKGLAAARAVQQAQAVVRDLQRDLVEREIIERWAERYGCAALDLDTGLTMADRREHRDVHNELMKEIGCPRCSKCGWRHYRDFDCFPTLKQVHREAKLAAQVDALFAEMPEQNIPPDSNLRHRRGSA